MIRRTAPHAGAVLLALSLALRPDAAPGQQPAVPPLPPVSPFATAPAAPEEKAPAYEPDLERLAELMGILAYLRDLCGKRDGAEWRARMAALLDSEGRTESRRDHLAGAFNRGFRGYEASYRTCTPSAELAISRSLDEGGRLARELSARFGGG